IKTVYFSNKFIIYLPYRYKIKHFIIVNLLNNIHCIPYIINLFKFITSILLFIRFNNLSFGGYYVSKQH
ncbi:hypothetical protein CDQ67_09560, partial [Campylobacter hyointestinalis subsp. hyointestinalis]